MREVCRVDNRISKKETGFIELVFLSAFIDEVGHVPLARTVTSFAADPEFGSMRVPLTRMCRAFAGVSRMAVTANGIPATDFVGTSIRPHGFRNAAVLGSHSRVSLT